MDCAGVVPHSAIFALKSRSGKRDAELLQKGCNLSRLVLMNSSPSASHRRNAALLWLGFIFASALQFIGAADAPAPAAVPAPQAPTPGMTAEVLFGTVCAQCHGTKGEGKEELKSPSIANLPAWYVINQLKNFQEGRRGTEPSDVQGQMMAAISKALTPDQIQAVAKVVESKPQVTPKVTEIADADIQEGMMLFQERCMECHRYNASGELAFGSPPLVGRQHWYLMAQIEKFKTGARGAVKGDVNGAKMVFTSTFIEDEQALKNVVGYILTLNEAPADGLFSGSSQ